MLRSGPGHLPLASALSTKSCSTGAWRAPTFLLQPEVQIVQVWDGEGCRIGTCHLSSVLPEVKLFGRVGFCEMTVDIFPELK